MARFTEVDPKAFPDSRDARRGRVYYPIVKEFMETGFGIGKLDRAGMKQTPYQLYAGLTHHIKQHRLPIKIVTRQAEIYMIRIDVDDEGNIDPNWKPDDMPAELPPPTDVPQLDADEVLSRFEEERDLSTK